MEAGRQIGKRWMGNWGSFTSVLPSETRDPPGTSQRDLHARGRGAERKKGGKLILRSLEIQQYLDENRALRLALASPASARDDEGQKGLLRAAELPLTLQTSDKVKRLTALAATPATPRSRLAAALSLKTARGELRRGQLREERKALPRAARFPAPASAPSPLPRQRRHPEPPNASNCRTSSSRRLRRMRGRT